jgi:mannosyltransferase
VDYPGVTAIPARPPASAAPGGTGRPGRRTLASWLVVVIPALAELAAGGYQIGRATLWRDEGYTRSVAVRPAGDIIALLGHQDAVHGLYYLLMHLLVTRLGASAVVLRVPSLIATSLAAGITAALGRELARAAGQPGASATGLLAGLLLVAFPLTTWYAQDARPYGMATLGAVTATYLLVRGVAGAGRWCWAAYAAAGLLLAALNLTAVLLLAAHGVSLLLLRARTDAASPAAQQLRTATRRWLAAVAAQAAALSPLIVLAAGQSRQLSWVPRPGATALARLVTDLCGTAGLIPLVTALALGGAAADLARRHPAACVPAVITLPWLVLPPAILLAVSVADPVYVERYVVFCMPAVALLTAGGLAWLTRLAGLAPAARRHPVLAAGPVAALLVIIAAAVIGPQADARLTAARGDNLRTVARVLARHERPGDAVLYMPWNTRAVSLGYPRPFQALRDIGLLESPLASATLLGIPAPAQALAHRLAVVRRLWTVRWAGGLRARLSPQYQAQAALAGRMRLIHRWRIRSVLLSLYAARRR